MTVTKGNQETYAATSQDSGEFFLTKDKILKKNSKIKNCKDIGNTRIMLNGDLMEITRKIDINGKIKYDFKINTKSYYSNSFKLFNSMNEEINLKHYKGIIFEENNEIELSEADIGKNEKFENKLEKIKMKNFKELILETWEELKLFSPQTLIVLASSTGALFIIILIILGVKCRKKRRMVPINFIRGLTSTENNKDKKEDTESYTDILLERIKNNE